MKEVLGRGVWAMLAVLVVLGATGCPPVEEEPEPEAAWEQAFPADGFGWLLSVAGSSPDEVYAVGGRTDRGAMMRFDGSGWSSQEIPEDVPLLNWVHILPDGSPVVAANDGYILRKKNGEWRETKTPTDQDLWGVWGVGPDNLWAVGGTGRQTGRATVLRYRGSSWSEVELPELERADVNAFFKVWGTGADNVYIVGQNGAVLHWDGEELTEKLVGTSDDLISLWGTGPDNIVLVGGRSTGVVVRWDGSEWHKKVLGRIPGINGVWMGRPGRAWVAGPRGYLARLTVPEGAGAVKLDEIMPVDTPKDFHAIYGVDGGGLYAVGGTLDSARGPFRGIAVRRGR
jgi:hypothetical protein